MCSSLSVSFLFFFGFVALLSTSLCDVEWSPAENVRHLALAVTLGKRIFRSFVSHLTAFDFESPLPCSTIGMESV